MQGAESFKMIVGKINIYRVTAENTIRKDIAHSIKCIFRNRSQLFFIHYHAEAKAIFLFTKLHTFLGDGVMAGLINRIEKISRFLCLFFTDTFFIIYLDMAMTYFFTVIGTAR